MWSVLEIDITHFILCNVPNLNIGRYFVSHEIGTLVYAVAIWTVFKSNIWYHAFFSNVPNLDMHRSLVCSYVWQKLNDFQHRVTFSGDILWITFSSNILSMTFSSNILWITFSVNILWITFSGNILWRTFSGYLIWIWSNPDPTGNLEKVTIFDSKLNQKPG